MTKWIKISIFIVLHIAAGYFFGIACDQTSQSFAMLFEPNKELLRIFILFTVAFCAVIFTAGLITVLVKPLWVAAISFAVTSAAILYGWGQYSLINIGLAAIYFIIGVYFSSSVGKALNERIKFSIQPVSENKGLISMALVLLVCGSIYIGGKEHVDTRGFEIPETYFNLFMEPIKEQTLSQLPAEARMEQEAQMEYEFERVISEFQDNTIKPLEPYIPIATAVMLFFSLSTVTSIVAFLPIMLLDIIIKLLQKMKITKIITETKEVERLVLDNEG